MAAVPQQHVVLSRSVILLALLLFALVWWRTAWLSDDAGITLRVVLNFINGLGPNFNIGERVQVYTHPLWFLLVSAAVAATGELYYTLLGLSLCCSLLAVYLLLQNLADGAVRQAGAALLLLGSTAFIDYSSSGLENPLSYLLLVVFLLALYRAPIGSTSTRVWLLLSAAALVLNRLDCALLVLPALIFTVLRSGNYLRWMLLAFICGLPLLGWFGFSLIYYGSLVPNTAYAKLSAGISYWQAWSQGANYLLDSLQRDLVTLPVIVVALLLGLVRGGWRERSLALGLGCYLLYIVHIGGDFMSGRFLAVPLLLAVVLLVQVLRRRETLIFGLMVVLLSILSPQTSWLTGADYSGGGISEYGVADERGFYFQSTGLVAADPPRVQPGLQRLDWRYQTLSAVRKSYTLGLAGLKHGPGVHVYDVLGLADPFLSRMPQGYGDNWRPGHFQRKVPLGYEESLLQDSNLIKQPALAEVYGDIRLVTRGPLWTEQRFSAIWRLYRQREKRASAYLELPPEAFVPAPARYVRKPPAH